MGEGFAIANILGIVILAGLIIAAPIGIWMTLHRIEAEQKKAARERAKQTKLLSDAVELLAALVPEEEVEEG